jgi:hypothetical protein
MGDAFNLAAILALRLFCLFRLLLMIRVRGRGDGEKSTERRLAGS